MEVNEAPYVDFAPVQLRVPDALLPEAVRDERRALQDRFETSRSVDDFTAIAETGLSVTVELWDRYARQLDGGAYASLQLKLKDLARDLAHASDRVEELDAMESGGRKVGFLLNYWRGREEVARYQYALLGKVLAEERMMGAAGTWGTKTEEQKDAVLGRGNPSWRPPPPEEIDAVREFAAELLKQEGYQARTGAKWSEPLKEAVADEFGVSKTTAARRLDDAFPEGPAETLSTAAPRP